MLVSFLITSINATHISSGWFQFIHYSCLRKLLIANRCFINIRTWIWSNLLIGKDIRLKNELLLTILMVQILLAWILTTETSILFLFTLAKALTVINFVFFTCVLVVAHFRLILHWSDILITLFCLLILLFLKSWCDGSITQKLFLKILGAHVIWSHATLFFRYLPLVVALNYNIRITQSVYYSGGLIWSDISLHHF